MTPTSARTLSSGSATSASSSLAASLSTSPSFCHLTSANSVPSLYVSITSSSPLVLTYESSDDALAASVASKAITSAAMRAKRVWHDDSEDSNSEVDDSRDPGADCRSRQTRSPLVAAIPTSLTARKPKRSRANDIRPANDPLATPAARESSVSVSTRVWNQLCAIDTTAIRAWEGPVRGFFEPIRDVLRSNGAYIGRSPRSSSATWSNPSARKLRNMFFNDDKTLVLPLGLPMSMTKPGVACPSKWANILQGIEEGGAMSDLRIPGYSSYLALTFDYAV